MVNKILQSYLNKFAIIYINDILVYSDTKNDHVKHLKMVLNALKYKNKKMQIPCCHELV